MRTIVASLLATSLLASNTFAATQSPAPLPAGKPAGIKDAALLGPSNALLILLSAGIAIGGIALAVSNPGGQGVTTPTTILTTTTTTTTTTTSGTSS